MFARSVLLLALYLPALAQALVVGGAGGRLCITRPAMRQAAYFMKSDEDKEFEEWVKKKRQAAGVDEAEDFGTGRRVEGTIYAVGGFITIAVPVIAGLWAYNEGYLTPQ